MMAFCGCIETGCLQTGCKDSTFPLRRSQTVGLLLGAASLGHSCLRVAALRSDVQS